MCIATFIKVLGISKDSCVLRNITPNMLVLVRKFVEVQKKLTRGGSVLPTILSSLHVKQANMVSNVKKLLMEIGASELVLQFYTNAQGVGGG